MIEREEIQRARQLIESAGRLVVLTGAGISAESGVPTFRGEDGLWKSFRAEELATPQAFARDPRLVWEWYGWRREIVAECRPNDAHLALARLAWSHKHMRLVTQNVDGLHEAAVFSTGCGVPKEVLPIELHGSLFRVRCSHCGLRQAHRDPIDASSLETLPHCQRCGSLLRPDVVWFGEPLDHRTLDEAYVLATRANVCLVVGTSAIVHPAAGIPLATRKKGGTIIEVNPEPTPLTAQAEISIRGKAAEVVPLLAGEAGP